MENSFFLGIDTGTSSSKGVIMNSKGKIIAVHSTSHEMTNPKPFYYEHDADKDWWGDFCIICKNLIEKSNINPSSIKSVGLSALGADCLPVDEKCTPLRKAILYGIDARAEKEIDQLTKLYGKERINKWYGRSLCSSDVMPKILWIKNNEPEIYQRTYKFVTASTFLSAKLTGNYKIDRFLGLASFNPMYDPISLKAIPELCSPICRPDQLAEIGEATDIAGKITKQASKETGLAEGTPVIIGTDDSGAEAISTGVVDKGRMMIQFGSSIYMILGTDRMVDDERLWREEFIVPGIYDISAGTNTAGSLIDKYKDVLYNLNESNDVYKTMRDDAARIPIGSEGLITLPYFAGERTPINDPKARGVLCGLTLAHTKSHMYRSLLESIGYSINQQLMIMKSLGVCIDEIFAVGGGASNPVWMQIVADITGETLHTPTTTIGASYGDAMMAAIGVCYPGFENFSKLKKYIESGKDYIPNGNNHEKYKNYQQIYDELYVKLKDIMHRLSR